tara:strand:- start:1936 stop:3195 length:1260 start_codon:yes stop_codon:yes gene_type:complete
MKVLFNLAWLSIMNRSGTATVTVFSIMISVALLLGMEQLRQSMRNSFLQTVAGVDLVVGARGDAIPILLYSVFRLGDATNNLRWQSYLEWAADERVEWTIPLSLGDSHKGYRVLGTTSDYWSYYRYGKNLKLDLKMGEFFDGLYEAVIGSVVAEKLGYQLNQQIVIAHGVGNTALFEHDDQPFQVVGILEPTGTPVDQTIHVSLEAIEAIHIGWEDGFPSTETSKPTSINLDEIQPKSITAFLVRLKSKMNTFRLQGEINAFEKEPLSAILPGVTMQKLWKILGIFEKTLMTISALVILSSLTSLISLLLATLNERRREMAILRSVGAGPLSIFYLLWIEATLICFVGIFLGFVFKYGGLIVVEPIIQDKLGLQIFLGWPGTEELLFFSSIMATGMLMSLFPAWRAYRISLHDGLLQQA